jgi:metal-responsive CopG/Arc/MetJ family transcriptional regulator
MKYKKVMLSLPDALVKELERYARMLNQGNKSGFVAQAIEDKIQYLRKAHYTEKMRESYKAAAARNKHIMEDWKHVDAEMARRLDKADSD